MAKRRLQAKASSAARLSSASTSPSIQKARPTGKRGKRQVARERTRAWISDELAKQQLTSRTKSNSERPLDKLQVDLSAALAEADTLVTKSNVKDTAPRGWRAAAALERGRLQAVMAAPRFVDGGLEALRNHLESTMSTDATAVPPPVASSKRSKRARGMAKAAQMRQGEKGRDKMDEATREQIARRKEYKADSAAEAMRMGKNVSKKKGKRTGKDEEIGPQTLGDLLGGKRRGRIGEKRDKMLDA